uniref:Uncharacterized protein n=1 Tax=Anguilla anguilla TaxID=7936 RepID=A0A0E9PZU0_ANGAN
MVEVVITLPSTVDTFQ